VDIAGAVRLELPPELRSGAPAAVTVGVRPEHLVPAAAGAGTFRFAVETVEALGADSHVHGNFGGAALVARIEGHSKPRVGESMAFSVMPGKLHFFDTATGKRLMP